MPNIMRKNDPNYLNLNKERNFDNTVRSDYNCGGYAMGTFTWLSIRAPYNADQLTDNYEDFVKYLTQISVEELVDYFAGLVRPVDNINEVKEDEFAVLFRLAVDEWEEDEDGKSVKYMEMDDYHFVKCHCDGTFSHKMGSSPVYDIPTPEDAWGGRYRGPIQTLAVSNKLY